LDHLESLLERAEELGSWRRRYVYNIQKGLPGLVSRLEQHGKLEEVRLWTASPSVATEIETILGLGRTREERLSDLGCYFALQILQQNLGSLAVLRFQVRTSGDRHPVYHRFLRRSGDAFETLVAAYAGRVLQIFLGDDERPEFVLCAVGTKYHQDDVDIGVIDDGDPSRINLHRAVGRLSNEMLRRASEAHLYISEHVGKDLYCASIPEYHELLDREIQDFIVIGEMLAARPLIGSRRLFEDFRRQITSRYIFQKESESRFHEGYLRGILGEIRSLRLGSVSSKGVHLKNDGLRLIQSLVFAMRTVAGVTEPDLLKSIDILREVRPEYRGILNELERTLVFLETFRLLYQLLVGEQEDVPLLGPEDFASLRPIAEAMGYADTGPVSAEHTVLVRWLEHVERVREISDRIVPVIAAHFSRISTVLRRLAPRSDPEEPAPPKANLALDLAEVFAFQRGTRYWDDLLEALEADDCLFLRALVEDLGRLSSEERAGVIEEIARWSRGSFVSGIRLLLILKRHGRKVGDPGLFDEIASVMTGMMDGSPDEQRRLATVFRRYPQLVSPFVLALRPEHVQRFEDIMEGEMIVEGMAPWRDRLVILAGHSRRSSRYFKRYLERVTERLPMVAAHLEEPAELHMLAKGLMADAELTEDRTERDRLLGEFYDIEFLRGGLSTLAGTPHAEIGDSFTRFTDQFVEAAFDLAKQEIEHEEGEHRDLHDLLAVYATGGHARGQAYDDDYDLLAILASDDPGDLVYANWLVSRLNRKLVRRGLIPHHRCVDWIGRFIVTFEDLREHLDSDEPDIFIDQCQLLGARRVVGSRVFEERLLRRVREPLIFRRSRAFLEAVRKEVDSRRKERTHGDPRALNIKEDPGGLREIEMTALASKAVLGLRETSAAETLNRARVPWLAAHKAVDALCGIMAFLNHVRAGYRLTVAASDIIELDQLDETARIVGEGKRAGTRLALKLQSEMARASRAVDEVLAKLAETDPRAGVVPLHPPVGPSGG
jgi:hypothetical protein